MPVPKSLLNTPPDRTPDTTVSVNGAAVAARTGEWLIDVINRHTEAATTRPVPQVCYLKAMGPIETCDTCMVEVDGRLVRACGTQVSEGMSVLTESAAAD